MSPHKFREIVFQLLYSTDFAESEEPPIELIMGQLEVSRSTVKKAWEQVLLVRAKQGEIDRKIVEHSKEYTLDRIPRIERNILRLSLYELFFSPEIPPKVAIAEAIRLCRKFATPEASTFVNAVADQCLKSKSS